MIQVPYDKTSKIPGKARVETFPCIERNLLVMVIITIIVILIMVTKAIINIAIIGVVPRRTRGSFMEATTYTRD